MKRRGFLGALLASPVTAKAAIETGAAEVSGIGLVGAAQNVVCEPTALDRALSAARSRFERKQGARRMTVRDMPEHIQSKRSWSGAFKVHVHTQESLETQIQDLWSMTDEELMAFFIKRGMWGE